MSLGPKKDGGPNVKFFESPEILSQLESVKTWLQKNCKKVRRPSLAPGVNKQRHVILFVSVHSSRSSHG